MKPKEPGLLNESSFTLKQGGFVKLASLNDSEDDTDIYKAELLARWDINGSTSWEPRRNILDREMLHNFKPNYFGFDEGVDVLNTRDSKRGKRDYHLHFHGRPQYEDSWVKEDLLIPEFNITRSDKRAKGTRRSPFRQVACRLEDFPVDEIETIRPFTLDP